MIQNGIPAQRRRSEVLKYRKENYKHSRWPQSKQLSAKHVIIDDTYRDNTHPGCKKHFDKICLVVYLYFAYDKKTWEIRDV